MNIENLKISDIKPYEKNAKRHPQDQIDHIANSLKRFGWKQPLVIDENNVLVVGHGRLLAAKKLKMKEAPCVRADDLTEDEIKAFRLADNKTAESEWNNELLEIELEELDEIEDIDMSDFGFDSVEKDEPPEKEQDDRDPSCQHNVFENQDLMQFPCVGDWGMPEIRPTQTTGDKMCRFMDWKEIENPEEYIAHFYYDDYKFIAAWRDPEKYLDRLRQFKAVVSPDFSLYTDFPRALQMLSCYRRQWCGAFWNAEDIDVIPDVVWGDEKSYEFCFDGIPKHSTVAISTVGVKNDKDWNGKIGDMFKAGYEEMMKRLEPTTIIFYGDMIEGLEGNIIRVPSFYEEKRKILNERVRLKNGQREK